MLLLKVWSPYSYFVAPSSDQFRASGAAEYFPLHPHQEADAVPVPAAHRALFRQKESPVVLLTSWRGGEPARSLVWLGTWVEGRDEACTALRWLFYLWETTHLSKRLNCANFPHCRKLSICLTSKNVKYCSPDTSSLTCFRQSWKMLL